jgi:hypothetical protein
MKQPPNNNMPLTPSDPKLSTLPKPVGKRAVGGFKLHDTVANVKMSLAKSVKLCHASAIIDWELKKYPPTPFATAIPRFEYRPIRVIRTPASFLFADVR